MFYCYWLWLGDVMAPHIPGNTGLDIFSSMSRYQAITWISADLFPIGVQQTHFNGFILNSKVFFQWNAFDNL